MPKGFETSFTSIEIMRALLRPGTSVTERGKPTSEEAETAEVQWRDKQQNAWAALRMIHGTVETLGPPGTLMSEEQVLAHYDPEPIHEATAILEALHKLLGPAPSG